MKWKCPKCEGTVDFKRCMEELFDEKGIAEFDAKHGLFMHTIECNKCDAHWIVEISEMNTEDDEDNIPNMV